MPFLFFFSLADLATTMSRATADTARTEIPLCAQDHVPGRPTAVGPGKEAGPFPLAPPLAPPLDDTG